MKGGTVYLMHNYTNIKIFALLFVVLISCSVVLGCSSSISNLEGKSWGKEKWSEITGNDWVENTTRWLKNSYVEKDNWAAFGEYPYDFGHDRNIINKPNLYVTYNAIKLYKNIGKEVENKDKIIAWINSLQKENGSFNCPIEEARSLMETYWAVATLSYLGVDIENSDKVIDFVMSLQREDGLFNFDKNEVLDEGEAIYATIYATEYACKILSFLNENNSKAADALASYISIAIKDLGEAEKWDWQRDEEKILAVVSAMDALTNYIDRI